MEHSLKGRHVLSVSQFSRRDIDSLFEIARHTEFFLADRHLTKDILRGFTAACVFYQPSTRTFASFLSAMQSLGGSVIPIQGVDYSSVAKGESLEDTVRTLGCYSDVIVLRHPDSGASDRAAKAAGVPIINAGDGTGEHPTQALLDLYTIQSRLGMVDRLRITLMGDVLRSRTIHSLARLLRLYKDVRVNFVAPDAYQANPAFLRELDSVGVRYKLASRLDDVIRDTDVLYVTRVQKEYVISGVSPSFDRTEVGPDQEYHVGPEDVKDAPSHMVIMHPFPRVNELSTELDASPRAAYFDQIRNGKFVRAALLAAVLGKA